MGSRRVIHPADIPVAAEADSWPDTFASPADYRAFQRIVHRPEATHASVRAGRTRLTRDRMAAAEAVVPVTHGRTELDFSGRAGRRRPVEVQPVPGRRRRPEVRTPRPGPGGGGCSRAGRGSPGGRRAVPAGRTPGVTGRGAARPAGRPAGESRPPVGDPGAGGRRPGRAAGGRVDPPGQPAGPGYYPEADSRVVLPTAADRRGIPQVGGGRPDSAGTW